MDEQFESSFTEASEPIETPEASADFKEKRNGVPATMRERAYAQAAVDSMVEGIATVGADSRESWLDFSGWAIGTFVKNGCLHRGKAVEAITEAALAAGLEAADIERKLNWSIEVGLRTPGRRSPIGAACLADFESFLPTHNYIFTPTNAMWPAGSVDSVIGKIQMFGDDGEPLLDDDGNEIVMRATSWLDQHRALLQMTWAPGFSRIIEGKVMQDGGSGVAWAEKEKARVYNQYIPPPPIAGHATKAGPWLDHVAFLYPGEAEHIIKWFAHRLQKPEEKCNHALCLIGEQGVGKDSIVEPVARGVGEWNVQEASPHTILGNFNPYVKGVILRISEARDLGDASRYAFYEKTKTLIAAPPAVHPCNEKHLRPYPVLNVCGVLFTSNHVDGLFIDKGDRRHFIAVCELTRTEEITARCSALWKWYKEDSGFAHVVTYLKSVDLSDFDATGPAPQTAAWRNVVMAGVSPESAELADVLDKIGNPDAVTVSEVKAKASEISETDAFGKLAPASIGAWLGDRRNSRQIPHRFKDCGYVPVRNEGDKRDGLWVVRGSGRQMIYAKAELGAEARRAAIRERFGL